MESDIATLAGSENLNLTDHFTVEELTRSEYALRRGIDNTPDAEVTANLQVLAQGLERARTALGAPIVISSGYRSAKVNAAIGGAVGSFHQKGLAADFKVPGMSVLDACKKLEAAKDHIRYDKLIYEFGAWVHLQFADVDESPRMAEYTIKNAKEGYLSGVLA